MDWIIAIIVGGVIGWLASIVMRTDAQQGILLNIVVGIIGSFLGKLIGGLLLNRDSTLSDFDPVGLLLSFLGAVVLLAIVNMVRRGRVR